MTLGTDPSTDPFNESYAGQSPAQPQSTDASATQPPQPRIAPTANPMAGPNGYASYAPAYGSSSTQPYTGYSGYAPYNTNYMQPTYGQYGSNAYSPSYPNYPNAYGHPSYNPAMPQRTQHAQSNTTMQQTGTHVLNTMQDAMTRFARVSALIDDVLRHLHMLFDAVFGLGYSIGAVRAETCMWLAVKTGPVAIASRMFRTVASVWRLLSLFLLSPMAGRFSPVALVLRILGLVPDDADSALNSSANAEQELSADNEERHNSVLADDEPRHDFSRENSNM